MPLALSGACTGALIEDNRLTQSCTAARAVLRIDGCGPATVSRTLMLGSARPFELAGGANAAAVPAVIEAADVAAIAGSSGSPDGSVVELFADAGGSLARFIGTAALAGGRFTLEAPGVASGEQVRALVTEPGGATSEASAAFAVP